MRLIQKILSKLIARLLLLFDRIPAVRREWFKALKGGDFLASSVSTEIFVVSTTDKIIGRDVYAYGSYDVGKLEQVIKLLPPTHSRAIFVDVGANIGTISIPALARNHFKRGIAIEPEALNFRLLKANVVLNGLESVLALHNVALGAVKGPAVMELSPNNSGDHRIRTAHSANGRFDEAARTTITIQSVTLDELCSDLDAQDALIWIDTQGYEGFVLEGGKACLSKKIPLVMEFWPYAMRQACSYESLKKALISAGYKRLINLGSLEETTLDEASIDALYQSFKKDRAFTDILVL